tara:strand:+ start:264 stop:1043 length:780 start_codon:yes stop_codon:yes gene_type:complete
MEGIQIETRTKVLNSPEIISNIIICQCFCRGWFVRRKNIYGISKKFKILQSTFEAIVKGYHMINKTPIKEVVWEEVNCDIVRSIYSISDEANGNHTSGKDNRFDNIDISNKSTKTDKNNVRISSYRLTSVCNDKDNGNPQEILNEIEKRDDSFDYYSILIRSEINNAKIYYAWYIIPKDYYIFKIDKLTLKIGQQGKKKGEIVGWKSKYCDITFSMSSQLWYNFNIDCIEKYKICSTEVDNSKSKINYSQIYHSIGDTI